MRTAVEVVGSVGASDLSSERESEAGGSVVALLWARSSSNGLALEVVVVVVVIDVDTLVKGGVTELLEEVGLLAEAVVAVAATIAK